MDNNISWDHIVYPRNAHNSFKTIDCEQQIANGEIPFERVHTALSFPLCNSVQSPAKVNRSNFLSSSPVHRRAAPIAWRFLKVARVEVKGVKGVKGEGQRGRVVTEVLSELVVSDTCTVVH